MGDGSERPVRRARERRRVRINHEMQSLFAAARRKSLQTKSIRLVRLACWFDAAAVTVPFPRRAGPSGQSAQITATPWPGPIPQLRREIKAHSVIKMASFTAFRVAKGNLSGKAPPMMSSWRDGLPARIVCGMTCLWHGRPTMRLRIP